MWRREAQGLKIEGLSDVGTRVASRLKRVLRLVRHVLGAGSSQLTSARERRQARAANAMGLGLFAVSWPYIFLFGAAGQTVLSFAVLVTCVGYLSAPLLNKGGHHYAAKVAPCVSGITVCDVLGSALGPAVHIHVSMFMLTGWSYNLFDVRRHPVTLLVLAALPGVLYAFVEFQILLPVPTLELHGAVSAVDLPQGDRV